MKKLLIMACMVPMMALGQTKDIDLSRNDNVTPFRSLMHRARVYTDTKDTSRAVFVMYYDERYPSLRQLESIMFADCDDDSSEVFQFLDDLKQAKREYASNVTMTWERKGYTMMVMARLKAIAISQPDDAAYVTLTGKQADALIAWFKSIGYSRP